MKKWDRKSIRLKEYDYSKEGFYFVTINTYQGQHLFGDFIDNKMILNDAATMIEKWYFELENKYKNAKCREFIVMPNHFHGILIIKNDTIVETTRRVVSTPQTPQTLQPNSLGSIIGQFKSVCTKRIRNGIEPHFQWQARFYDHIIRNEGDANRIRQYIRNNPVKWQRDMNNPKPK